MQLGVGGGGVLLLEAVSTHRLGHCFKRKKWVLELLGDGGCGSTTTKWFIHVLFCCTLSISFCINHIGGRGVIIKVIFPTASPLPPQSPSYLWC